LAQRVAEESGHATLKGMKITSSAQDAEAPDTDDNDLDPLVWANHFKGLFVRTVCDEGQ
jgi:hypothetical protein